MLTLLLSTIAAVYDQGEDHIAASVRPCRMTPCILTRIDTNHCSVSLPNRVAVAVSVTVTIISIFPCTIMNLIKSRITHLGLDYSIGILITV